MLTLVKAPPTHEPPVGTVVACDESWTLVAKCPCGSKLYVDMSELDMRDPLHKAAYNMGVMGWRKDHYVHELRIHEVSDVLMAAKQLGLWEGMKDD